MGRASPRFGITAGHSNAKGSAFTERDHTLPFIIWSAAVGSGNAASKPTAPGATAALLHGCFQAAHKLIITCPFLCQRSPHEGESSRTFCSGHCFAMDRHPQQPNTDTCSSLIWVQHSATGAVKQRLDSLLTEHGAHIAERAACDMKGITH